MRRRFGIMAMSALAVLGGCARQPFVDSGISVSVDKTEDPIRKTGQFAICHPDDDAATLAEVEALAREKCASLGFEPLLTTRHHYQCRLLIPHRSTYQCVDYSMKDAGGRPINPFAKGAVQAWKKAEAAKGRESQLDRPMPSDPLGMPMPSDPLGLGGAQTLPPPDTTPQAPLGGWGDAWQNGEPPPKPGVPSALP